jgi:predicted metal-dependent enzyme (double-stranded beta helix superfamily)
MEAVFDLNQFIADCKIALAEEAPQRAIREIVTRAVADPAGVLKGLSEPKRAGIQKLFHSANLTVLNVVWAPRMTLLPHDHRMWAVIGIYTGREDNIFWYRVNNGHKIAAARAKALCEKDVELLGCDVIHSVTNPISRLSGAIHVYTGDFFGAVRSEWDPETLLERPCDVEKNLRLFEEANGEQRPSSH